jgi:hypothetical protein
MSTSPNLNYESLNWVAGSPLPRDRTQSQRLTIYFDTEETRKAYKEMPIDHPNEHLPFPASDEDDRGG